MIEKYKFSVLMSLYVKEKPSNLKECLESLENQTLKASEWIIVEDGPLNNELYQILDEYEEKYPDIVKRISLKKNRGLGLALREGVKHCSYELIARMDTDDICRKDRFEKQVNEFENNPNLDICGSHITEFEGSCDNILCTRRVPLEDKKIKKYQRRRDGLNHVTVMFKKSSVLAAGNYQSCLLMEDTHLWARMFINGAVAMNIDDSLVYVRVGKDMFERRGGYSYYKKYKIGRKQIYKLGYISRWDYYVTLVIQFIVTMIPNKLRALVFVKLLHR